MNQASYEIERLVRFGTSCGLVGQLDALVARNTLLDLFGLGEPYTGALPQESPETPTEILTALSAIGGEMGLYDADVHALRVNFEARIMGALMPRESEVCAEFERLYKEQGARAATDYFYRLCIVSNYIRTADIARNIKWGYASPYGDMEITINLTKPEKDPKTIALERSQPAAGYPKCMLCLENIGYGGRINFPARQTHRVVPVTLAGEPWYLQYSPYVYYNEHCIVFGARHEPMKIDHSTFVRLFDFVRQFPHYTCGSNADLPIVGGSILSHNHFQGGNYAFPMQRAAAQQFYHSDDFPEITIQRIHWPVSTIRCSGQNMRQLIDFADLLLHAWRSYSDEGANILAYSGDGDDRVAHNTVTPILHYTEQDGYILDLVPRNNATSAEYPDGIFHPHQDLHHIKKENIGLIEVMGLAILPSRLKEQSKQIADVLCGVLPAEEAKQALPVHREWIDELCARYGTALNAKAAETVLQNEIGAKFARCLEDAGVFKQTAAGAAACDRFMASMGCAPIADPRR